MAKGLGHLVEVAAERGLASFTVIVGIHISQMAQRGFALDRDVVLVVIHVKESLCRVLNAPDNDRRDLDWITALVVDLQLFAIEGAGSERDFVSSEESSCNSICWRPGCRRRGWLLSVSIEGIGPVKTTCPDRA